MPLTIRHADHSLTTRTRPPPTQALKNSLEDVRPLIKMPQHPSEFAQATCLEATWQMTMLELQSWSPSHTGGVVEGSMDEALVTMWVAALVHTFDATNANPCTAHPRRTSLATSRGFMFNPDTVNLVKPHIDWFLHYLDSTLDTSLEAPWVALYAFEAFSVTWQMMHAEVDGVMEVVGIGKGDFQAARAWALKVFARRTRSKLGRLIMATLGSLGKSGRG